MASTRYQHLREQLAYLRLPAVAAGSLRRSRPPNATNPATPSSSTICSPPKSTPSSNVVSTVYGCQAAGAQDDRAVRLYRPTSRDRRLVDDLATLRFIDERANLINIGPAGVGKAMLATALGHKAVEAGYRVYCTTPPTSSPAAVAPRSKVAGPPRCASGTAPAADHR
jgi:hypothetical protein